MRHLILSGLAAAFLAPPVVADTPGCDPAPHRAADPSRLRAVQRFENTFPNGFRECASIVFRSEAPGLFQEIVLYDTGGPPLALYLRGARFRDEIRVIDFVLSDSPTEVVNLLQ